MSTPEIPESSPEFVMSPEGLQAVVNRLADAQKAIDQMDHLEPELVQYFGIGTAIIDYRRKKSLESELLLWTLQQLSPQPEGTWQQRAIDMLPQVAGIAWNNEALRIERAALEG